MCRSLIVLAGLTAPFISSVEAHHSAIAFEMSQVVAFDATVTSFDWRNPHVYLTVEDHSGVEWLIETDATPVLSRSGWARDSFATGDAVSVRVHPDKDPEKAHALLLSIEGPGGVAMASMNRVDLPSESRVLASTDNIGGVWTVDLPPTTDPVRFPMAIALRSHPVTEKARAERAAIERPLIAECLAYPTPLVLALSGLYLTEIELRDDLVLIRNEYYNTERTIYMDGRDHAQDGERTLQGHSVGSWENDTLIVDTRLFADHPAGNGPSAPSGAQKHVVETFSLSEDGSQVLVDVFLEDPEYLAEPFHGTILLDYSPHLEMLSFECDPEVARRFTLD